MGSAQGAASSPFNEQAAQNGFQSQQGAPVQPRPSLVSQTSSFQQSTGQPPFLVQYGTNNQGQFCWSADCFCELRMSSALLDSIDCLHEGLPKLPA